MQAEPEITFRGFDGSESLRQEILQKISKLHKVHDRLMCCRVAVEIPHKNKFQGDFYRVRVDLTLPGDEIVVERKPDSEMNLHEDPFLVIQDAFHTVENQLKKKMEKRHDRHKSREMSQHGIVTKIFTYEGYGFLEDEDGREIYFNRQSVSGHKFENLNIQDEVRCSWTHAELGPQATTVVPVGKNGHHVFDQHN